MVNIPLGLQSEMGSTRFCPGPSPFAIYVNDLLDNVKSSLLLFADDTKLYHTIRSCSDVQQLQEDIDALYQWTRLWLLSLNISK